MARYYDLDKLSKLIEARADTMLEGKCAMLYVAKWLNLLPTADVVEVVKCKDCKRCYEKRTKLNNQLMRFCMRMDGNEYKVNANDFCSYGTPKERGGEK